MHARRIRWSWWMSFLTRGGIPDPNQPVGSPRRACVNSGWAHTRVGDVQTRTLAQTELQLFCGDEGGEGVAVGVRQLHGPAKPTHLVLRRDGGRAPTMRVEPFCDVGAVGILVGQL